MRLFLVVISFLGVISATAQISLGRQFVGSVVITGGSEIIVSSSSGEPATGTIAGNELIATQGFQQPTDRTPLTGEVLVAYLECWDGNNAFLDVSMLSGCGNTYEVLVTSGGDVVEASGLSVGSYEAVVVSDGGCTSSFTIEVTTPNITPCDLIISNTITPNDDGINDFWEIQGIAQEAYAQNAVTIVDRWGRRIWASNNYGSENDKLWYGQDQGGNEVIEGVYYYQIELPDGPLLTGFINLLR